MIVFAFLAGMAFGVAIMSRRMATMEWRVSRGCRRAGGCPMIWVKTASVALCIFAALLFLFLCFAAYATILAGESWYAGIFCAESLFAAWQLFRVLKQFFKVVKVARQ